jgi:hypothetical protein
MAAVAGPRPSAGAWPTPIGVVVRDVDPWSGLVLADGCDGWTGPSHREFFLAGFEPAAYCPGREEPPASGFWTDGRVSDPALADDGRAAFAASLASGSTPR